MTVKLKYLAQNQTSNATLDFATYGGHTERCDIYFSGTFDGASVNIQASPLNEGASQVGFVLVTGLENITSAQKKQIYLSRDTILRAVISGVGASTDITISIRYDGEK